MLKKRSFLAKTVLFIAILALVFLLATNLPALQFNKISEEQSLQTMRLLIEKYSLEKTFSPNQLTIEAYLNELAVLNGKSTGSAAKIIEAEQFSAQAFYYLNQAMQNSTQINYTSFQCKSKETVETISSLKIAQEKVTAAEKAVQSLSDTQKKYLRENQSEMINNYSTQITLLKKYFDEKCR